MYCPASKKCREKYISPSTFCNLHVIPFSILLCTNLICGGPEERRMQEVAHADQEHFSPYGLTNTSHQYKACASHSSLQYMVCWLCVGISHRSEFHPIKQEAGVFCRAFLQWLWGRMTKSSPILGSVSKVAPCPWHLPTQGFCSVDPWCHSSLANPFFSTLLCPVFLCAMVEKGPL